MLTRFGAMIHFDDRVRLGRERERQFPTNRGASGHRNYHQQFSNPGSKPCHGAGLASRSFSSFPFPSRRAYHARFAPRQPLPAFQSTRSTSFRHYTISFVLSLSLSLTRRRVVPDIAPRRASLAMKLYTATRVYPSY